MPLGFPVFLWSSYQTAFILLLGPLSRGKEEIRHVMPIVCEHPIGQVGKPLVGEILWPVIGLSFFICTLNYVSRYIDIPCDSVNFGTRQQLLRATIYFIF